MTRAANAQLGNLVQFWARQEWTAPGSVEKFSLPLGEDALTRSTGQQRRCPAEL